MTGELSNLNKLRYPTHGYGFADFPLALKSLHHSYFQFFSEPRAFFFFLQSIRLSHFSASQCHDTWNGLGWHASSLITQKWDNKAAGSAFIVDAFW